MGTDWGIDSAKRLSSDVAIEKADHEFSRMQISLEAKTGSNLLYERGLFSIDRDWFRKFWFVRLPSVESMAISASIQASHLVVGGN